MTSNNMPPPPIKITCGITVQDWNETKIDVPVEFGGCQLQRSRAEISRALAGQGIDCSLTCNYSITYEPVPPGSPVPRADGWFDGHDAFSGTLLGRAGTFAMRSWGKINDGIVTGQWEILGETASPEFRGIRGSGKFTVNLHNRQATHPAELDVWL